MYAQLGDIRFEGQKGFSKYDINKSVSYAEIPIVGGKPRLQRTGSNLDQLSLSFLLHFDFSDVKSDVSQLNDYKDGSDILPLVLGNGDFVGNFVIKEIKESVKKTDPFGNYIYTILDISLSEYPSPDVRTQIANQAVENAFASSIDKVVPDLEVVPLPTVELTTVQDINVSLINGALTDQEVSNAVNNVNDRPSILAKVQDLTTKANAAALDAANGMRQIQSKVSNAQRVIDDAENVAKFASDTAIAAATGDIDNVLNANQTYQQANKLFTSSSSILVSLIGTRQI